MSRFANVLLNLALVGAGLALLVLLYGLAIRTFTPRTDPVRDENPAALAGDRIQLEVRNGAGEPGLAAGMTHFLRRRGFDVVESGNWSSFNQQETVVLDRIGNPDAAARVANALGLPRARVRDERRDDLLLDVSVVIGHDFRTLPPFRDTDP
ncbi:MAG: LytR C-terminal domain-containing protein [Rubricoccaceae bacterium]|nr:LytR C-terminal domain-containing protein [Rubricoccaceae bacterium]